MRFRYVHDLARVITDNAKNYDRELCCRSLLLVCMDKHRRLSYMEVSFRGRNYMHLTGLRMEDHMSVPAEVFYSRCLTHRLSLRGIAETQDSTFPLKMDVLPFVCNDFHADMITDYDTDHPMIYTERLPGGMKRVIQLSRDSETGSFVPGDLRCAGLERLSTRFVRVIAVYRKGLEDERYTEILHSANGIDWDKIQFSDGYEYLPRPGQDEDPLPLPDENY